jgi:hypothetical protein
MNINNFAIAFFVLTFTCLTIATSSIAVECYHKTPGLKEDKIGNYYFILTNLSVSVIISLISLKSMYNATYSD